MNNQNLMRHTISKCKRALNSNKIENIEKAYSLIVECDITLSRCFICIHDDIGYCGLRDSVIPEHEIHRLHCLPNFVRYYGGK